MRRRQQQQKQQKQQHNQQQPQQHHHHQQKRNNAAHATVASAELRVFVFTEQGVAVNAIFLPLYRTLVRTVYISTFLYFVYVAADRRYDGYRTGT